MAALGLPCCVQACSGWHEQELLSRCTGLLTVVASWCPAQAPGHVDSVVVVQGLQRIGSVVVMHRISCPSAWWIFLDQESS